MMTEESRDSLQGVSEGWKKWWKFYLSMVSTDLFNNDGTSTTNDPMIFQLFWQIFAYHDDPIVLDDQRRIRIAILDYPLLLR